MRKARQRSSRTTTETSDLKPDIAIQTGGGAPGFSINAFRIGLVGGLGVLTALLIGGVIGQLSTVLIYIGVALFLALGLDPLVTWLEKRIPRALAILLVVIAVLGVFAGLLFAVIPVLINQGTNLINDLPKLEKDLTNSALIKDLENAFGGTFSIQGGISGAIDFISDPKNLVAIGGGIAAVGAGVASGVTGATIVLILTLYFLASLRSMKGITYRFVPAYRRVNFAQITEEITGAVGRYVVGQVSLALVNGILSLIFLSIIGAPLPFLLAVIAFLGSLIPLVGTLTASIINTLICLFVSPLTALIAGIYYLVYMQIEAYVLSPRIMNRAVAVPGAIVVIAAVGGGAIGGILGALVAIPVAASAIIIVQKVVFPLQDAKKTPAGPGATAH
ncbi:AI-2E family transporter [Mycetocola zhujimingii]|uniref:AI-2E family transporter n=1 Tax=Mycetocola zhujimingii TaxID=2079792 RepID=A0A2U1TD43_9MICO|nr:AI-2E family transporter [Mycetocola zhujimingii]AWB85242.1 AI-2E family transporter [Mycetocola zhujimingii]PWC06796.1 AI-2E family transporter [Mycetocola zhujimingii]